MRGPRGIRLLGAVDTDYRPTRRHRSIEFIRVVGQKKDPVVGQSDCRGNRFVGRALALGPGGAEVAPAADPRRQLTAPSVREPILLIANRTRREYVQRD